MHLVFINRCKEESGNIEDIEKLIKEQEELIEMQKNIIDDQRKVINNFIKE